MNLLLLAPDIQERLLSLPRVESGPDPIYLKDLQKVAKVTRWLGQLEMSDVVNIWSMRVR